MNQQLPPIVQLAKRLLVEIEQAVRKFTREFRYGLGADLRRLAMDVAELAQRTFMERKKADHSQALVWVIDRLNLTLQLGKDVHAFASFAQFEGLARLGHDLGKQAGGWHRQQLQQHPKGQSSVRNCGPECATTLSTPAASLYGATA